MTVAIPVSRFLTRIAMRWKDIPNPTGRRTWPGGRSGSPIGSWKCRPRYSVAQQWFAENGGYQIIQKEEQLRPGAD
jgi:hypothetical protein